MGDVELLFGGCALVASVAVGLLAHECSHALVLRAIGVEYAVEFFPGRTGSPLRTVVSCPWASVRPTPTGTESPWTLRLAALAPLSLVVPVAALGAIGSVPAGENAITTALAIGWLACAIPSPQDFSVAFHAPTLLAESAEATTDPVSGPASAGVPNAVSVATRADPADD